MASIRNWKGEKRVLEDSFDRIYTKFKLHFYQAVFSRFQTREASLTAVETFCMEIIRALDEPTINEFASFANLSSPNAAYKVNSLIRKGYVEKVQSPSDRREYHLRPTQKFHDYYNLSSAYIQEVMNRVRERFTPEEVAQMDRVLSIVGQELMPEVTLK
jgi:DNA-binding MarR family transcriptional regulator